MKYSPLKASHVLTPGFHNTCNSYFSSSRYRFMFFPVVSALESAYSCVCTFSSCTSMEECCTSIETWAMIYDWCSDCHTDSCHRYSYQARYFVDQQRNPHLHLLVLSTS